MVTAQYYQYSGHIESTRRSEMHLAVRIRYGTYHSIFWKWISIFSEICLELNSTEVIDYVDSLGTVKTIVDVFRKTGSDWGVIGADVGAGSRADEVDLYAELSKHISDAVGWTRWVAFCLIYPAKEILFLHWLNFVLQVSWPGQQSIFRDEYSASQSS